jgi:hypothetical protein
VIKQITPRHSLETLAVTGKLKYFRHIMHTSDSLEKALMLGLADGSRIKETADKMNRQNM